MQIKVIMMKLFQANAVFAQLLDKWFDFFSKVDHLSKNAFVVQAKQCQIDLAGDHLVKDCDLFVLGNGKSGCIGLVWAGDSGRNKLGSVFISGREGGQKVISEINEALK